MDDDHSGDLTYEELTKGIRDLGLTAEEMSDAEIHEVFKTLDTDGSGKLNINEFIETVRVIDSPPPIFILFF